jgi:hypothetical protein
MSSTYAEPLDLVERGLDELAAISPEFRSTRERKDFLVRVARIKSRVAAEELRVLAVSDDIAEVTGPPPRGWPTRPGMRTGRSVAMRRWVRRWGRSGPGPVRRWVAGR